VGKHWGGGATGMAEDSPAARLLQWRKGATQVGMEGLGDWQGAQPVEVVQWRLSGASVAGPEG
jgi:hypothetical protein